MGHEWSVDVEAVDFAPLDKFRALVAESVETLAEGGLRPCVDSMSISYNRCSVFVAGEIANTSRLFR